jgi:ABC-type glutathione transport system ATPase component
MSETPLVSVRNLSVELGEKRKTRVRVLHGIDLDIFAGETVALVGESGSGKSTLGRAILGLLDATEGQISYHGDVLPSLRERRGREARRTMRVVFQDPFSSLNPSRTVGYSLSQGLHLSRTGSLDTAQVRVAEALIQVGLPIGAAARYPSQFSGGQRQRIAIARALISRPDFVVCGICQGE